MNFLSGSLYYFEQEWKKTSKNNGRKEARADDGERIGSVMSIVVLWLAVVDERVATNILLFWS